MFNTGPHAPLTASEILARPKVCDSRIELLASDLPLLELFRRRAEEFGIPFEAALKQALAIFLIPVPVAHNTASQPKRP